MVDPTHIIKRAKVLLIDARADCEVDEAGVALRKITAAIALLDRVLAFVVPPGQVVDLASPDGGIAIDDRMSGPSECATAGSTTSRPRKKCRTA